MKSFISCLLLTAFIPNYSTAQETTIDSTAPTIINGWVFINQNTDGDKWFIKDEYVTKNNEGIKIWVKEILPKKVVKGVTYKNYELRQLFIFNCDEKQMMLIQALTYTSSGKVLSNYRKEEYEREWVDVVPQTVSESLLNSVCEMFNQ